MNERIDAKRKRVLFLCTHNSSRSQIAEALLREKAGDRFEVLSAGTDPTELHPFAVLVMNEIGIDVSAQESKHIRDYFRQPFDWVITVCDRAREKCPIYPLATWLHWSIMDPESLADFRSARDELARRITAFIEGTYIQDGAGIGGREFKR